jgi:hypothetical protein
MKSLLSTSRTVVATVLASTALLGAGTSLAHADTIVYRDAPQVAAYEQPHMMPVDVSINIGWHGDRYWDGHRYWAHDDWMHRHPHDHDPRHDDHGPDHR